MAKTRKSKSNLRKTRKNQRGGDCRVKTSNNKGVPSLKVANTCGPGSQVHFPDLQVGQKVKIVGNIDSIIITSSTNEARKKQGNSGANAAIKDKLRKENEYVFQVEKVEDESVFRTVTFKVVAFPETNTRGHRTGKNHTCSVSNDEFDKELCLGFKLKGPKGELLYREYSFYRVN
jgi:hypothetical protein